MKSSAGAAILLILVFAAELEAGHIARGTVHLTGAGVEPRSGSIATGICRASFDSSRHELELSCVHEVGLPLELRVGIENTPLRVVSVGLERHRFTGIAVLTPMEEVSAMAGPISLVLTSVDHPEGEIGGRLLLESLFVDGFESGTTCAWAASVPSDSCDAIAVARWGDDANNGTFGAPKQTIQAGIDAAFAEGKSRTLVANGGYFEQIELAANVQVLGGFSPDFSVIDNELYQVFLFSPTPAPSVPGAVNCLDVSGGTDGSTSLEGFTVFSADTVATGSSTYGFYLKDCDRSVRIAGNSVHAGLAGRGADGGGGSDGVGGGVAGLWGVDALDLFEEMGVAEHDCLPQHHSPGGPGASGQCGAEATSGGDGGERVCPAYDDVGSMTVGPTATENGIAGSHGAVGGAAGWDVYHQAFSCDGYQHYGEFMGQDGAGGVDGIAGAAGDGCLSAGGTVVNGLWQPSTGSPGDAGTHGEGGGGGGSGAGAWVHGSCFAKGFLYDNLGGTGGGGGSGGCSGTGGLGGSSGGGSFAVFVNFSTPPASVPEIVDNTLHTGWGGDGGFGGSGGLGESGGLGGNGGAGGGSYLDFPVDPTYPSFPGGGGGDGGDGGDGGGGGGGCGGPAFGIYAWGAGGLDLGSWTSGNSFVLEGGGGTGGQGGYSPTNPGGGGDNGEHTAVNF
jgi:hypothetical protein